MFSRNLRIFRELSLLRETEFEELLVSYSTTLHFFSTKVKFMLTRGNKSETLLRNCWIMSRGTFPRILIWCNRCSSTSPAERVWFSMFFSNLNFHVTLLDEQEWSITWALSSELITHELGTKLFSIRRIAIKPRMSFRGWPRGTYSFEQ